MSHTAQEQAFKSFQQFVNCLLRSWSTDGVCFHCQTTLSKETSAVYDSTFWRDAVTNFIWGDITYVILEAKSEPRQTGMKWFLESLHCKFSIKLCQCSRFDMSRHMLKFFTLKRWFDKGRHYIKLSSWHTERQPISQCLCGFLLWRYVSRRD